MRKKSKGFTLIELLVVIGMLAILAAVVLIAINPARQFAQARNAARQSDTRAILDACWHYAVDNNGKIPTALTTTPTDVGTSGLSLSTVLVPTYITDLPKDPDGGTAATTKYLASKDANGRVTVSASNAELGVTISVTR
jgi:type IV pilus assembly protein PilA